jgi:TRAP-type mannitol/chloroaromatic compound transport system permease small subunit
MQFIPGEGKTSYAKWATGTPAADIASRLPSWPRWARLLVGFGLLVIVILMIIFLILRIFRG